MGKANDPHTRKQLLVAAKELAEEHEWATNNGLDQEDRDEARVIARDKILELRMLLTKMEIEL